MAFVLSEGRQRQWLGEVMPRAALIADAKMLHLFACHSLDLSKHKPEVTDRCTSTMHAIVVTRPFNVPHLMFRLILVYQSLQSPLALHPYGVLITHLCQEFEVLVPDNYVTMKMARRIDNSSLSKSGAQQSTVLVGSTSASSSQPALNTVPEAPRASMPPPKVSMPPPFELFMPPPPPPFQRGPIFTFAPAFASDA